MSSLMTTLLRIKIIPKIFLILLIAKRRNTIFGRIQYTEKNTQFEREKISLIICLLIRISKEFTGTRFASATRPGDPYNGR